MMKKNGFSLIEILVTISVLTVIGVAMSAVITRSFQGNTKTELIGTVKQNGQAAMAIVERDIRNSDSVVCPTSATPSLVLVVLAKDSGNYIRFNMTTESGTTNGSLTKEIFAFQTTPTVPSDLCNLTTTPLNNPISLIDSTSGAAVSLKNVAGTGFSVVKSPGFKDTVNVQFNLGPHTGSAGGFQFNIGGTTNAVNFQTTVQVR